MGGRERPDGVREMGDVKSVALTISPNSPAATTTRPGLSRHLGMCSHGY